MRAVHGGDGLLDCLTELLQLRLVSVQRTREPAMQSVVARMLLGIVMAGMLVGTVGVYRRGSTASAPVALAVFAVAVLAAGIRAWWDAFRQTQMATWEPTPRPGAQT